MCLNRGRQKSTAVHMDDDRRNTFRFVAIPMRRNCLRLGKDLVRSGIITVVIACLTLTACATRKVPHVEVTPRLCWRVHDYGGSIGSGSYQNITNYWVTNCYAPFVVLQGVSFTMDFARHDFFISPDTQKHED